MPTQKPTRKPLMLRCTWASLAPRSAAIAGRLGRYMSIDSGPNATSADNSSNRRRSPLPS